MARVIVIFAALAFLSGVFFNVKTHRQGRYQRLPDSLSYADTISEGAGTN